MSTSNRPQLIGVAGTFASGKDLIAHYLSDHYGYTHPSTSELVRNIAMKEEGSVERPVLQSVAKRYRETYGSNIFLEKALLAPRPTIITGLRSLGEAKIIRQHGGIIVFVDAPVELRYERMRARDRDGEIHLTLEEFKAGEAVEWYAGDDDPDFNLRGIKVMADIVLDSTPPREEFLRTALEKLGIR